MKVKTLLKVNTSRRIEITENAENDFRTHNVDYIEYKNTTDYGVFVNYPCDSSLPDRVLNADIKYVSVNVVTGALQISLV